MRYKIINTMGIFIVLGAVLSTATPSTLIGQNIVPAKCAKMANMVTGLNYHRSSGDSWKDGQVWRFAENGRLNTFAPGSAGLAAAKRLSEALWSIETEDRKCVLKVTTPTRPPHTVTYRIVDMTWAIVNINGADKHVPDFEDHSGMKTRYCGIGEVCEKLWR
jgi:hypothetical protein